MTEQRDNQRKDTLNHRRLTVLALLALFALAFALRMGYPTLAEFKYDEANVVRRAQRIAYEGHLPVAGVGSSMGAENFPLTLYLLALPLRLWSDPVAAVLFTGFLNGLAVVATYLVGRNYFGPRAGLIAAFLFAVSGWAVLYGRKIWSRTLPLFTLLFVASLLMTVVRGRRWALTGAFVALGALVGLQLEGLAFGPILVVILLVYRRRVALKPLLVGAALLGLCMVPYAIHDALRGWPNVRAFLDYGGGQARLSLNALRYAFSLVGSRGLEGMAGALAPEYRAGLPPLGWIEGVMSALLVAAVAYACVQALRGRQERRAAFGLLLIWFGLPIALQTYTSRPTQPHYFVLLYPAQFLLVGALLSDLPRRARRWSPYTRAFSIALISLGLATWAGWQLLTVTRLFTFMVEHPTTGGYGIPLRYTRAAARLVDEERCPGEVVILGTENDPAFDELPAIFDALLYRRPRSFSDSTALPVPDAAEVAYLVGPVPRADSILSPLLHRLDTIDGMQPGRTLELPHDGTFHAFCRRRPEREDVLAGFTRLPAGIPFANDVVLAAHRVPDEAVAGTTIDVWTAWWVRQPPPSPTTYQFFVHLLDEGGTLRSQYDGNGYSAAHWEARDLVLSRFPLSLPSDLEAGSYRLRWGIYTLPEVETIRVLDAEGAPVDDGVNVATVTIRQD